MTDNEKKLVEDNHNLIYFMCHKYKLNIDEYYDLLAISLCKAAIAYDESKGKFSTLATYIMENDLRYNYRSSRLDVINTNCVSLDEIHGEYDTDNFTMQDLLQDPKSLNDYNYFETYEDIINALDKLNIDKKIKEQFILYYIYKYTQVDIAKKYNDKANVVASNMHKTRNKLREYLIARSSN